MTRMLCDQCEMVSINGIACHEHGCPNHSARWDGEQFIRQYKCRECGCMADVGYGCDCQGFTDEEMEARV